MHQDGERGGERSIQQENKQMKETKTHEIKLNDLRFWFFIGGDIGFSVWFGSMLLTVIASNVLFGASKA